MILAFKWYCSTYLADKCRFYTTDVHDLEGAQASKGARKESNKVGVKFGHPALYKPLITPMVHAKAKHILGTIYQGRTEEAVNSHGYSDIAMHPMSQTTPGKTARLSVGNNKDLFEVVPESNLDFTYFKNRADFAAEHGGEGELYGRPQDLMSERSQTPRSFMTSEDDLALRSRSASPAPPMPNLGQHPSLRSQPSDPRLANNFRSMTPNNGSMYNLNNDSQEHGLLRGAQYPAGYTPVLTQMPNESRDRLGMQRWATNGSNDDERMGGAAYEAYRPGLGPQQQPHRGL